MAYDPHVQSELFRRKWHKANQRELAMSDLVRVPAAAAHSLELERSREG